MHDERLQFLRRLHDRLTTTAPHICLRKILPDVSYRPNISELSHFKSVLCVTLVFTVPEDR